SAHGARWTGDVEHRRQGGADVVNGCLPMVAPGPDEGGRAPEDHRHVTVVGIRRAVRRARGAIHPVGVVYHDHVAGMRGIETIAHTLVDAVACASVFLQLGTGVDPCDIGERAQGGDGYIFHLCPADGLSRKRRECEISSGRLRYCCNAYCCKALLSGACAARRVVSRWTTRGT